MQSMQDAVAVVGLSVTDGTNGRTLTITSYSITQTDAKCGMGDTQRRNPGGRSGRRGRSAGTLRSSVERTE